MKKLMMLGIGMAIGMMISDCNCMRKPMDCVKKPMKKVLKKINIE